MVVERILTATAKAPSESHQPRIDHLRPVASNLSIGPAKPHGNTATKRSVSTRAILTELPALAAAIASGTFDVNAKAVPLSEVEQAWVDAATSSTRIVLTPQPPA